LEKFSALIGIQPKRSAFARDWLENCLQPTLGRVIAQVTQSDPTAINLLFVVD
jgi:hypothetical protein